MMANLTNVITQIETATWAEGDRAIVLIGSISSDDPDTGQSLAYNLSKNALNQLARFFCKTLPVRINVVSPATFTGPNAIVTKQEVANVVEFLCSPKASGINGQNIKVNRVA